MRIVLIGFRGCGKSRISYELSQTLFYSVYSTDRMIEQNLKMSIAKYVEQNGWEKFRKIETDVIVKLEQKDNIIIDCGGGVVEKEENMMMLVKNSFVIWVDASFDDIYERITNKQHREKRPLLSSNNIKEDIEINYKRRTPMYQKYAHLKIYNTNASLEEMMKIITTHLIQFSPEFYKLMS